MSQPLENLTPLRVALHAMQNGVDIGEDELCRRAEAFVDAARTAGWPAERMLVELKEILRATPPSGVRTIVGTIEPDDAMARKLISLCIKRYYETD